MEKVTDQIQGIVQGRVKEMVNVQLAAAGFDPELSAGDMSVRKSVMVQASRVSYAGAATAAVGISQMTTVRPAVDKKEDQFRAARRSLRLWPIEGGKREGLEDYLRSKLRLDENFIREELGEVLLRRPLDARGKNKIDNEYIVTFESKHVRDTVKAAASNLANFREMAGMKLHVPGHLQRDFQALMNLSYDLKKKHTELKRNIKFDEEDLGLFMDIRLSAEGEWKRVKPDQAAAANKSRRKGLAKDLGSEELKELLGESDDE